VMAARTLFARPKESILYQQIIDAAEILCLARLIRLNAGRRGRVQLAPAGYPDLFGWLMRGPNSGRAVGLECKRQGEELSPVQEVWAAEAGREGVLVACVESVQQAVDLLRGWVRT
jgi:hypothetical protein